ncbi:MAG: putative porin [Cytophagales bacterium]|nr:putative porin [Cytophagales bacterium]MDW8384395.1 putative porin [Flammeovirgaceae bacterium]
MRRYFLVVVFFFTSYATFAQQRRDASSAPNQSNINDPFGNVNRPQSPFDDSNSRIRVDESGRAIQDDSTKQIYGAFTTQFWHERDWFENTKCIQHPDTTLLHLHRYNAVAKSGYLLQDLGNVGTATFPVYVQPITELGTRHGFDVYNPHIYDEDRIRYYNTKSPFSFWEYVQGGNRRSLLDVGYARNIGPYINISGLYHRIDAPLLVANQRINNNDKQVRHQTFLFSFNAKTANERYKIMANASKYFHNTIETGGVLVEILPSIYTPFMQDNRGTVNRLYNATAEQYREKWRLYHEFELLPGTRLFHRFTRYSQRNAFSNDLMRAAGSVFATGTDANFYRNIFLNPRFTYHKFVYQFYENQQGVKYQRDNKLFFALWHRQKSYVAAQEYMTFDKNLYDRIPFNIFPEHYAGVVGRIYYDSTTYLRVEQEHLLRGNYVPQRKLECLLHHNRAEIGFFQYQIAPSLPVRYYFGNHFRWNHSYFSTTFYQKWSAKIKWKRRNWSFKGFLEIHQVRGYVYWDTAAIPRQVPENISYSLTGLNFSLKTGDLMHHLDFYQLLQKNYYMRMPQSLINYQVYFQKYLFRNATLSQMGFDFHYHTSFYKQTYMPVTQQFHLQDVRPYGDYLIAELFVNFIIKNTRVFIKITNLLQKIGFNTPGYYVTPHYAGQAREFEFGLSWYFYD